jgi:hypothetical protein
MARFASPRDVAEAVAFLADAGLSGFVNGVSLPVDGGWLADASLVRTTGDFCNGCLGTSVAATPSPVSRPRWKR